ncbi:MAG: hypothetical protein K0R19_3058 [Bacillota bacterium]|jgi:hypothetical protein|nr:hypothetical protein [Bacillota bacterium]
MKPLITIETVPISIEYVEKKAANTNSQSAHLKISQENNKVMIQSNPIDITPVDTFEYSSSIDLSNLSYTATAAYSGTGSLSMNVRMESNADPFHYKQVARGIDNIFSALPQVIKSSSNSSSGLESIQINFDMSQISGLPPVDNLDTSFLPPDLELKVVERPKVIIKYVGGPLYIPRSADPEFVPPEDFNQIFDGRPNIDIKA